MNTDPSITEQQQAIAAAAANYTSPEPQSHATLMPHRDSIATLRNKGASYRAIAKILDTVNIRVSLDTLSRFCRETIEQKPERGGRRRFGGSPAPRRGQPPMSEPPPAPAAPDSLAAAKDEKARESTATPRGKGPRIADPTNI